MKLWGFVHSHKTFIHPKCGPQYVRPTGTTMVILTPDPQNPGEMGPENWTPKNVEGGWVCLVGAYTGPRSGG